MDLKKSLNSYLEKHKNEPMGKVEISKAKAKKKALRKYK